MLLYAKRPMTLQTLNPHQRRVLTLFEDTTPHLARWLPFKPSWWQQFKKPDYLLGEKPYGIYLWGSVGRGKTALVDHWITTLPYQVFRMHYHEFMLYFHELKNNHSGARNPVASIARKFKDRCSLLFLDEFVVSDITDAMILMELLRMFALQRIFLITTSNSPPSDLYHDGFQRKLFIPAIKLIESSFLVCNLEGEVDYRYKQFSKAITDWNQIRDDRWIDDWFAKLSGAKLEKSILEINNHELEVSGIAEECLLITFESIVGGRRSASDYISLAKNYRLLVIKSIPDSINDDRSDAIRRFVNLVDVWYDHNRIILVAKPSENWYTGDRLQNVFKRTKSRLSEMMAYYTDHSFRKG